MTDQRADLIELVWPTYVEEMRMTITEIECRLAWTDAAIMYWLEECRKLICPLELWKDLIPTPSFGALNPDLLP